MGHAPPVMRPAEETVFELQLTHPVLFVTIFFVPLVTTFMPGITQTVSLVLQIQRLLHHHTVMLPPVRTATPTIMIQLVHVSTPYRQLVDLLSVLAILIA